ncbi:MAG: hemolysin family protein [Treponema sp.]|jgi:putative hemolysin|nr:hemolysin family protein [Treponema sp.]
MARVDPLVWQILLLFVLLLINSFFTCAEVALISLNKNRLEKMSVSGNRQAKRILTLTRQPSKFIASVQVLITLAGFLSSAFAASNFSGRLANWFVSLGTKIPAETLSSASVVIITLILSYFTLVFGELLPKRIALKKADTLAFAISGIVLFFSRLLNPAVWLLTKTTNGLLRVIGINPETDAELITEEEIRLMIDVGSAKGAITNEEKEILNNVFELNNRNAGEVMTHRRDTVLLWLEDSDEEWEKTISENKCAFFPVCGKDTDDIAGVLKARDYLCLKDRRREAVMAKAVKPAQLVPITVRTDVLFERMKKNRNHFAVVLDEHGSMMGIVTMKDLLEELVGNLNDDISSPPELPLIKKTGLETWIVNGAISLDKAALELDVSLPVDRYDTFSGFVFSLLGGIPEDGSQAELEYEELKIKILVVREHRLEKALVKVRKHSQNPG